MNAIVPQYLVEAAGWTLIHSLWQSVVIAIGAGFLVKMAGNRSARVNYAIYCLGLATCVCWAAFTFAANARGSDRHAPITSPSISTVRGPNPFEGAKTIPQEKSITVSRVSTRMPVIVALWCLGVAGMTVRGCLASLWVRRMRRDARTWEDAAWQKHFRERLCELSISKPLRLCLSTLSEVPAVVGHLAPIVLLPCCLVTRLTPAQLEAVILHELMHIRRNDYLVNVIQIIFETLFFFNPAVWWLSHAIRAEREHCCDEAAAAHSGTKMEYAKALLRLEELRLGESPSLVLAANSGSLQDRIARLFAIDRRQAAFPAFTGVTLLSALAFAALIGFWPRAQAQPKNEASLELHSVVPSGTAGATPANLMRKGRDGQEFAQELALDPRVLLGNADIAEAKVEQDPIYKEYQIAVRLTREGRDRFADITRTHVGKQLAILVNGRVVSAPIVNEPITGGALKISGSFAQDEAEELAKKLRRPSAATSEPRDRLLSGPTAQELLGEAQKLRTEKRYEEALQRHLRYHVVSRNEPGQGGVRVSFALSYWLQLGQEFPPALDKLKETRDSAGDALKGGDIAIDPFTRFQEFAAINQTLREDAKTVELFRWLDANDPEMARRVYFAAQKPLLKAGEKQLAAKYADPNHFEGQLGGLIAAKTGPDTRGTILPQIERIFREQTATLVALLSTRGDNEAAEAIVKRALEALSDDPFKRSLDAALRGELPE